MSTLAGRRPAAASVHEHAARLFEAFETGVPVAPPTEDQETFDVPFAYHVQQELRRLHEAAGRAVIGRKVGLTSLAMQAQLGVTEPDFGLLLDSHVFSDGSRLRPRAQRMIAPRLEAELGFVLEHPLRGPGIGVADVLAATREVVGAFEVIDSRVADWRITLPDTIADNASCFGAVVGASGVAPDAADLDTVGLVLERDGEVLATAAGAAVLGHPALAVAWLANTLAGFGEGLAAGELVLAGSFTAAVNATPGCYRARFGDGVGTVEVFVEDEDEDEDGRP